MIWLETKTNNNQTICYEMIWFEKNTYFTKCRETADCIKTKNQFAMKWYDWKQKQTKTKQFAMKRSDWKQKLSLPVT